MSIAEFAAHLRPAYLGSFFENPAMLGRFHCVDCEEVVSRAAKLCSFLRTQSFSRFSAAFELSSEYNPLLRCHTGH